MLHLHAETVFRTPRDLFFDSLTGIVASPRSPDIAVVDPFESKTRPLPATASRCGKSPGATRDA